jgi:hypothetical protein
MAEPLDDFKELVSQANERFNTFNATMAALETGIKSGMKADAKKTIVTENLTKRQTEVSQSFSTLKEEINKNKKSSSDARKSIDELLKSQSQQLEAIDKTYPALKEQTDKVRAQIAAQVQQISSTLEFKKTLENLTGVTSFTGKVLGNFGTALSTIVKSYQGGSNDISMATSATSAAFGAIGSTSTLAGDTLKGLGETAGVAATGTGRFAGAAKIASVALTAIGSATSFFGKVVTGINRDVLPILNTELINGFNNFNAINASGAIFADGLTGMVNAAAGGELTLSEFNDVLKSSSPALASLGIGVTDAAKQMGAVGMVMRREGITASLKNLGLTAKEQSEAVASTMAQMRQGGNRFAASDEVVAAQTQKYAENLKIIAAITGEDAKKQEAKVRDEANRLAFQQAIAGKSAEEQSNILDAMKNMSDAQRKAFEETVVFGQAVTPASAALMQQSEGFANIVRTAANDFQSGTLDATKMRQTQADFGEQATRDLINNRGIAMAGFAGVGGLAEQLEGIMGQELQFRKNFTAEAIAAAEKGAKSAETTTDPLTKSMETAAEAGRKLSQSIQDNFFKEDILKKYADAVTLTTSVISNAIQGFTSGTTGGGTGSNLSMSGAAQGAMNGAMIGAMIPILGETGIPEIVGGLIGAAIGSGILDGAARSQASLNNIANPNSDQNIATQLAAAGSGGANGMIASGPTSGYLAKLHGTEAVLPSDLTDMLTEVAQNKMDDYSKASLIESIVSKNANQDMNLRAINDDLMNTLISKVDDLINATQDVARYTKETSVRIM